MQLALILLGLALTCLGIFGWLWLCAGFRNGGWRGMAGTLALQASALGLALGLIMGDPVTGVYYAVFPPLAVVPLSGLAAFPILRPLTLAAAPYGALALVACLLWRPLRPWSPGLALLTTLLAMLVLGERASQDAMCKAARARGFASFQRNALDWSLANLGQDPVRFLHGLKDTDGLYLGWSYRKMDWYDIKAKVGTVSSGPVLTCPTA